MIQTQFSKIAKIRQQACDSIEKELVQMRHKEHMIEQKIAYLYYELDNLEVPKKALSSVFMPLIEQKRCFYHTKKQLENDLQEARSQIFFYKKRTKEHK